MPARGGSSVTVEWPRSLRGPTHSSGWPRMAVRWAVASWPRAQETMAEVALVVATTMMNVAGKRGAATVRWEGAPAEGINAIGDNPWWWDHDSSQRQWK